MNYMRWCLPVFFCFLTLLLSGQNEPYKVLRNSRSGKYMAYSALKGDSRKVVVPVRYRKSPGEMRGVWVVTFQNMDFRKTVSPHDFMQEYRAMLGRIKKAGFNAVFFQIRSCSDAFYPSAMQPYSRFIRGREGFGYGKTDILKFMIDETYRQGLTFHAWLNPFRVTGVTPMKKDQYLKTLAQNNFARMHSRHVISYPVKGGNTLFLNPGESLVRLHLVKTVQEIVRKYNPDSIVFDDYFYPYSYNGNQDLATYRKYCRDPKRIHINDWRRENINMFIRDISAAIRSYNRTSGKKKILFGVSPFGIWLNSKSVKNGSPTTGMESYYSNYSNTIHWIRKGYLDYVIPQIYWKFDHTEAPYACLADWWSDQVAGTAVKLYIGIAVYRDFTGNVAELRNQILFNQRRKEIDGEVFYSYRWIFSKANKARSQAVGLIVKDCWKGVLP